MDFDFDDDQRMLAESVRLQLSKEYGLARRRAQQSSDAYLDHDLWREWGALGWLGVMIPEAHGGIGQDLVSAMLLVEAFGEHLVIAPLVESLIDSGRVLERLGSADQRGQWLPRLADGAAIMTLAHGEAGAGYDRMAVACSVRTAADGYILCGTKSSIPFAASADRWIVTARLCGDGGEEAGISALLVDPSAAGIAIESYHGIDGTPMADLRFDDVRLPRSALLGEAGGAWRAIDDTLVESLAATCIEAVGVMSTLLRLTLDYVKMRNQFGAPIGSFQAIQHRLADMYMKLELARPLAWLAVHSAGRPAEERHCLLAAAKAQISESCRFIGEQAVQLHGGIGMTDEAEPSHAFRRLVALEKKLGDRHHHVGTIAHALAEGKPTIYA